MQGNTTCAGGAPDLAGFDPTTVWGDLGQASRCLALHSNALGHGIKKDMSRPKSSTTYWLCCECEDHKTATRRCCFRAKIHRSVEGFKLSLGSQPGPCLQHSPFCTSEPQIGSRATAEHPEFRQAMQAKAQEQKGPITLKQITEAMVAQQIPVSTGGTSLEAQKQNAYRIRKLIGQPESAQTDLWCKAPALVAAYQEQNPGSSTPPLSCGHTDPQSWCVHLFGEQFGVPVTADAYVYLEYDEQDPTVIIFAFICPGHAIEGVLRHFAKKCLSFDGHHQPPEPPSSPRPASPRPRVVAFESPYPSPHQFPLQQFHSHTSRKSVCRSMVTPNPRKPPPRPVLPPPAPALSFLDPQPQVPISSPCSNFT